MNPSSFHDIAGGIQSLVTAVGIVVGAIWTYRRFIRQREGCPKVQFDLSANVHLRAQGEHIVEIVAALQNKGVVRHWLNEFKFDLLYLPKGCELITGDDRINKQTLFTKVISNRHWIPPDWKRTFIDPGMSQIYTYVTSVPSDSEFLLIYATFRYPDEESEFHTAQKLVRVEQCTKT